MNKRVAVIGRGFGGLNIALKLVVNGFQVALYGKKDTHCASKAAIGVCSIKGIFEGNVEEGEFEVGQIAAYLDEIESVEFILNKLLGEYQKAKNEMLSRMED